MISNIILLIILILINGVFSATELAFLSVNKFKIQEDIKNNNKKAIKVDKLLQKPNSFLSTIQIGITLAGFLASAFAADNFADKLLPHINISFLNIEATRTFLVVMITLILSYFTLVFGELVPKKISMAYPEKIAYMMVYPINILMKICYPVIKLLSVSTNVVCFLLRIKEKENNLTEEDIKKMIITGTDEGIIEEKEKEYLFHIFEFNDTEADKVMTPRENSIVLDKNEKISEIVKVIRNSKYTRYPVCDGSIDNIIGILNVKDLIMFRKDYPLTSIETIVRPIKKFRKTDKIDDIFRIMQTEHIGMSIIYDNDRFCGIITLEDAIEEIVGNIYDEFDYNQ